MKDFYVNVPGWGSLCIRQDGERFLASLLGVDRLQEAVDRINRLKLKRIQFHDPKHGPSTQV